MIELDQLEEQHAAFASRNTRVVVATIEGREEAEKSQRDFPHLTLLTDAGQSLLSSAAVIQEGADPHGNAAAAPTTVLIDKHGVVRWLYRPARHIERLSPDQLLTAIDQHLAASR